MRKSKWLILLITLSLISLGMKTILAQVIMREADEDLFTTPVNVFESVDMIYLQGDEIATIAWFYFEPPVIRGRGIHIESANLSLRTSTGAMNSDPDASATIYAIDEDYPDSFANDPNQRLGPYTLHHTNINLSAVMGANVWHNFSVTDICRELNNRFYFHDDLSPVAFVIVSDDSADAERYVSSLEAGYPARLYVEYGQPDPGDPDYPPGLPPDAEFVEDYRNHTIWKVEHFENASMSIYFQDQDNPFDFYYGDYVELDIDPTDHTFIIDNGNDQEYACENTITRINNTIIIMEDPAQVTIYNSSDSGQTWGSFILNDQFTDLAPHAVSGAGSMWTDVNGTTHMIWNTYTPTSPGAGRGVYSNFTILTNGTIDFYDGFYEWGQGFSWMNIETDQHGRIHVCWVNANILYYDYRHPNGTWNGPQVIRNTGDSLLETSLDVAPHSNASRPPVVRFVYQRQWVGNEYCEQAILESDGTLTFTLLSSNNCFRSNSGMWFEGNSSIAVYEDNPGGGSAEIEFRIFDFDTMTLGASQYVTSTVQAHHKRPDIGIDQENHLAYFIWFSQWNGDQLMGRRYNLTSDTFIEVLQILTTPMDVEWGNIIPSGYGNLSYTDWYVADRNGTLVWTCIFPEDCATNETDIEDIIDRDVIGYPDPEDPDPPGWEGIGFSYHRFKLIFLAGGLIMMCGPWLYGFYERPEAHTWIMIAFVSFCGVTILWALQTM